MYTVAVHRGGEERNGEGGEERKRREEKANRNVSNGEWRFGNPLDATPDGGNRIHLADPRRLASKNSSTTRVADTLAGLNVGGGGVVYGKWGEKGVGKRREPIR